MAKRVNTQICGDAGHDPRGGGARGWCWSCCGISIAITSEDPKPLLEQAKAAWKQAYDLVSRGSVCTGRRQRHARFAPARASDELFYKVAELDLVLSDKAKTPTKGCAILQDHLRITLYNAQENQSAKYRGRPRSLKNSMKACRRGRIRQFG